MRRQPGRAAVAVGLGLLALAAVDRRAGRVEVAATAPLDAPFFEDFSPLQAGGFRVAGPGSRLVIPGLWARAPVRVSLAMASARPKAQAVRVIANGAAAHAQTLGGRMGVAELSARTDDHGRLALQWMSDGGAVSVYWVRVEGGKGTALPRRRAATAAGFVLLCAAIGAWWAGTGTAAAWGAATGAAVLLLATAASRTWAGANLPAALLALSLALALAALARGGLRFPRGDAAWVGAAFAVRFFLATHPAFPAVDLALHAHRMWTYKEGQVVTNIVGDPSGRGLLVGPYPPAFYAAAAPFVAEGDSGHTAVRTGMALLEGTAPLLVFAVMRAGGAAAGASTSAAVAAAVMPEGMLVLAKGVAANIAGSWLGLWVLVALLRGASLPVVAALTGLAFLGHPGSAVGLAALIVAWTALALAQGALPRRAVARPLVSLAFGALLAWLVYYREVAALSAGSLSAVGEGLGKDPGAFFRARWVHLGKMLQNVVLKFGGGPLLLAASMRRGPVPPPLHTLLAAWLSLGAAFGALAIVTPFSIRFEYFVAPAVAMAAGLGAAAWRERGRGLRVTVVWCTSAVLQAALGIANLLGRLDPISVIIPSPRWPFPIG